MLTVTIGFNIQYFGVRDDQVPVIIIQNNDGEKYLKPNVEPDQIASWVKEYKVVISLID